MKTERYTLDTNVLVYAVERNEGWKHELAAEVVRCSVGGSCLLTVQALAEFVAVLTRKRPHEQPFALAQARDWLALFQVTGPNKQALRDALDVWNPGALHSGMACFWPRRAKRGAPLR
jgi:predicted nucleic acid-binding protein